MSLSEGEKKSVATLLGDVPLFSSLKQKNLVSVVNASTKRSFDSGETIARQGDSGVAFYMILSGQVEVRRGKRLLSKLGRGQFFGEMALFDQQPRSADVVAVEKTTCLLLTSWAFEGFVKAHSDVSLMVIKEIVRRLRDTDKALSE
ncbi:MAG: Crp/Fnr family transcriptional regulator [Nitrososphaerales archaeon]